ncbi:hypothetical protein Trydic_g8599, partial [Trypoxylus dichotomus]
LAKFNVNGVALVVEAGGAKLDEDVSLHVKNEVLLLFG